MFTINYFTGKRENENIALAWAAKFATKDSIFDKNFSLLGVGDGDDTPLLLKEGQNVFKFYASGRRYCSGLLATMELQSDGSSGFALARRKAAKGMQKEERDLQRYASLLSGPTGGRRWVVEELAVISESKEVAGDLITEAVLEQVTLDESNNKSISPVTRIWEACLVFFKNCSRINMFTNDNLQQALCEARIRECRDDIFWRRVVGSALRDEAKEILGHQRGNCGVGWEQLSKQSCSPL
ncbi:Uncharacterized protein CK203_054020 [Vitis vinifera]|uniref:Uncharacterized protein n=1 Tax=Vitis vinifera TaxID=29760 RepID=A0A438GUI2_VITVI|nr:Uncharacterized protein CK203_054020 [Vitis vinifera]